MQSKLAMWSTEDKGRKFDRLLRLIADRTWLAEAARITLASSGARTPGVDGVDKVMMEGNLHQELATIRAELIWLPLSRGRENFCLPSIMRDEQAR
jgi:RNA-directed DNA polymerase